MDSEWWVLLGYSAFIFGASFLAGKLSSIGTLTHTRTQILLSLISGFILGIAVFHMLPHAMERISGPESVHVAVFWLVLGIAAMVVLMRVFNFHHHDFSDDATQSHQLSKQGVSRQSVVYIGVGLSLHTVSEGVALGSAVELSMSHSAHALLPALGVFLAIVVHKPLDAYTLLTLMQSAKYSKLHRTLVNIGFALICPIVAVAAYAATGLLGEMEGSHVAGLAMAFAAGAFICIALSDLLPEIHFHSHDRFKLLIAFLAGLALSYLIYFFEEGAVH